MTCSQIVPKSLVKLRSRLFSRHSCARSIIYTVCRVLEVRGRPPNIEMIPAQIIDFTRIELGAQLLRISLVVVANVFLGHIVAHRLDITLRSGVANVKVS